MKTLYLVTARGGSKGVPGKNLEKIGGLSLVGWKIWAARDCDLDADIIVSTDSVEIAEEARDHGALVLARPAELATDEARSADVIKHALRSLGNGVDYDQVMLLEPSSPFATGAHMRKALSMMETYGADLVVGMKDVAVHSAFVGERRPNDAINNIILSMKRHGRHLRRQDLVQEWTMNGALYLFRADMFLATGDIYGGNANHGLWMELWNSIEIDTPHDLELARYAFEKGYVKKPARTPLMAIA